MRAESYLQRVGDLPQNSPMSVQSTSTFPLSGYLRDQVGTSQASQANLRSDPPAGDSAEASQPGSIDTARISDPGKLFSLLEKLSQDNPAEFKSLARQIEKKIETAAENSSDSSQASFLREIATRFQQASQSGSFADLFTREEQVADAAALDDNDPNFETASQIFSEVLDQIPRKLAQAIAQ
jgi:hypothetical protein